MTRDFELLAPENYSDILKKRIVQLEKAIKKLEMADKSVPDCSVRIAAKGGSLQFYRITQKNDTKGIYMQKKERPQALAIIQKEFDLRQIAVLQEEKAALENALKEVEKVTAIQQLEGVREIRKSLVVPATLSDQQYASLWLSQNYEKKPFNENAPELITSSGLRVRSKSEMLIAESLLRNGIPFRYEFPVTVLCDDNFVKIHPDFYCLNVRTRQEFAWEHFGMMDNTDYAMKAVYRQNIYAENGYFPGKNLIVTQETQVQPLSMHLLDKIISQFLK